MKLGFVGCGNMGEAIIQGIIKNKTELPENIYILRKNREKLKATASKYGINPTASIKELAENAELIILAVKPNIILNIVKELSPYITEKKIIVSIAAGIAIEDIEKLLPVNVPVVRTMPNINAAIGSSATALCMNNAADENTKDLICKYFGAIGYITEIEEDKFPVFSAIAGCSPAYVFMFINALAEAALKAGMNKKQALDIAAAAVMGSASMYLNSKKHPLELADMVCSPGGTTIEGVYALYENGFDSAVMKAVESSINKEKRSLK